MSETTTAPTHNMPRIALISIYVAENNGVRFLASSLRSAGYPAVEVYFKDYQHHCFTPPTARETELLFSLLVRERITLVGISLRAGGYLKYAAHLTEQIHQQLNLPVIWGGMHVTMSPEECLPHADMLALGECEHVIVDLARALETGQSPANIPSIWYKDDQGVVTRNNLRPLEPNLDSLPLRDFHSHDSKFFIDNNRITPGDPYASQTIYLMMSARGCLFNCSFCDVSALRKVFRGLGTFYRSMTPPRIIEECLYAKQTFPHLKRFRFDDELFCMNPEWVAEFSRLYKDAVHLPFEILTDPRVVNEETLRMLKAAGLSTVMMGIQNTANVNERLYNRRCSDAQVVQATRIIHSLGLKPCYQILLDDPHVSEAEKRDLFNFLCTLVRPFDLYLFSLSYWPQTDITDKYLADGTITPADVEGLNDKCLKQFRVDLSWPRPPEDIFWNSLYTLLSKPVIPVGVVRWLSRQKWLRNHPGPLCFLAQMLNIAKLASLATGMLWRGELTLDTIKRWLNWKSLATS